MKTRTIPVAVLILFLSLSGWGCVTPAADRQARVPSDTTHLAPERIAAEFVSRGRDLEEQGFPVRALRQYRIALTVLPEEHEARAGVERLETALNVQAERHFQTGMAFHQEGRYEQARREFLVTLRLNPGHRKAAGMLVSRKRVRSTRYIVHEVAPGESLSVLAKRYYGDYRLFPEIARYNNLKDATRLLAGQELRIPEIKGTPFLSREDHVETRVERPPEYDLWEEAEAEAAAEEPGKTQEARLAACLASGITLFERKKYRQAVEELERVLEAAPQDETAREYAFEAHYRLAEDLFEKKKYLEARERFLASLRLRKDCARCHRYAEKSEELFKETRYRRGIQYYNEENLVEAIREWEQVRALDPDYKRVDYLIEKSKKILANLEDLKKNHQQP